MRLFHGTDIESANKIYSLGFKKHECSDFGYAAYFSDSTEWANEYGSTLIEVEFAGKLLDLSIHAHFDIYKLSGNEISPEFDGLKDGHIIAIYNLSSIQLINYYNIL